MTTEPTPEKEVATTNIAITEATTTTMAEGTTIAVSLETKPALSNTSNITGGKQPSASKNPKTKKAVSSGGIVGILLVLVALVAVVAVVVGKKRQQEGGTVGSSQKYERGTQEFANPLAVAVPTTSSMA
jgi:uncharacterized protein HemX